MILFWDECNVVFNGFFRYFEGRVLIDYIKNLCYYYFVWFKYVFLILVININ